MDRARLIHSPTRPWASNFFYLASKNVKPPASSCEQFYICITNMTISIFRVEIYMKSRYVYGRKNMSEEFDLSQRNT